MAGVSPSVRGLSALSVLWLIAATFGMVRLLDYGSTPAAPSSPPERWPSHTALKRHPGRATLVMLAHPRCPCTRSTLGELAVIAAQTRGLLDIHVVFLWTEALDYRSGLWDQARMIPAADVISDAGGAEIRAFGALASGHVLVYDVHGRLAFSGGITSSRGHAGSSTGREAVIALAQSGRAQIASTPVFGCALREPRENDHRQ